MQSSFYARKMKRDDIKDAMVDGNSVTVLEVGKSKMHLNTNNFI